MKLSKSTYSIILATLSIFMLQTKTKAQTIDTSKFFLQNDADVAKEEPGTHNGGGKTIGYNFFANAKGLKTVFRKRTLKSGHPLITTYKKKMKFITSLAVRVK